MTGFIIQRAMQSAVTLLIVVTAVFLLARVLGDPSALLVAQDATREEVQEKREQLGLDRPIVVQYFDYLGDLAQGDLGQSIVRSSYGVGELIWPKLANSAKLAAFAMVIAAAVGVPLGILAAVKRGTLFDHFARVIALVGQVVPPWWLGIIMIVVFAVELELLPVAGKGDGFFSFRHAIMPAGVLGLFVVAGVTRLTRSSMLEVLDSEYIKLARAKGLPLRTVLWKHALRNALIPVVTFGGLFFGILVTGAIVIEVVFAWPGLGRVMFDALGSRDYPVMQGAILIGAAIVIGFNLLVDLLYGWIDPRIRYT